MKYNNKCLYVLGTNTTVLYELKGTGEKFSSLKSGKITFFLLSTEAKVNLT